MIDPWTDPDSGLNTYQIDVCDLGDSLIVPNQLVFRGTFSRADSFMTTGVGTAAMDNPPARTVNAAGAPDAAGLRTEILCTGAAPGWTAHELGPRSIGAFLRITRAGVKQMWELPIADNTASTVIVDTLGVVGNILHTDTLEILCPTALIESKTDLGGGFFATVFKGDCGVPGTLATAPIASSQGCSFERLAINGFVRNATSMNFDRVLFSSVLHLDRSTATMFNCSSIGGIEVTNASSVEEASGGRPDGAADPATTTAKVLLTGKKLEVRRGGSFDTKLPVSFYGSDAAGILVEGGFFNQDPACAYLGGDANTTYGIDARAYGSAHVRGGINTTITGTTNDLLVALSLACSYGTGGGEFQEAGAGHYQGNLHNTTVDAGSPTGDFSRIYV